MSVFPPHNFPSCWILYCINTFSSYFPLPFCLSHTLFLFMTSILLLLCLFPTFLLFYLVCPGLLSQKQINRVGRFGEFQSKCMSSSWPGQAKHLHSVVFQPYFIYVLLSLSIWKKAQLPHLLERCTVAIRDEKVSYPETRVPVPFHPFYHSWSSPPLSLEVYKKVLGMS